MKTRLFIVLLVVIGLLAALSSAAAAQAPSGEGRPGYPPTFAPQLTGPNVEPEPSFDPDVARPWRNPALGPVALPAAAPDRPTVDLGQPGLSFRYVQAFGQTGVPYFEDTSHLNFPYAVVADGNNVWIGESFGHRALKFRNDGTFVAQIGSAGVNNYPNTVIRRISDVAVDPSGNVWIVDIDAAHVVKFGPDLKYVSELGQSWNHASGNDRFDQPIGLVFDAAGNLYVSDGADVWSSGGNQRVQVFDTNGHYVSTIGQTGIAGNGNNQLRAPGHLAVYGDRLYVADTGNQRVQIFSIVNPTAPSYVGTIGITGQSGSDNAHFSNPAGVAVDANYVYVADAWNNRVQIFDRGTRNYVATISGSWGAGNDQLKNPTDVTVDTGGNVYVADCWNERVQQFNAARSYVRTYGTTGVPYSTDSTHFYEPYGVAVTRDGSIYVTEEYGQRLIKLDSSGAPLWTVGEPGVRGGWNGEADHLHWPKDVAVNQGGRVFVADQGNNRIQIFEPNGAFYATLGGEWGTGNNQFACPTGLGFGPNGDLYVADNCNHRVQIFSSSLAYVATIGVSGVRGSDNAHFSSPQAVAVDSAGTIYVADTDNLRVQVFGPDRAYLRTIGETGVSGDDFGHFNDPRALVVDAARNVYVGDGWATRVHVYDANGAYLTSFATGWGARTGQSEHVQGLAAGPDGAIYVADSWDNHRITKFAPGVPGWRQVNINGFGDRNAGWLSSLLPFQGSLYATGSPARIWRMTAAGAWSQANTDGFGDNNNREIDALAEFNGQLYAATYNWVCDDANCNTGHSTSPQVWRSANGAFWANVTPAGGFGAGAIWVNAFVAFNNQLYMSIAGDSTRGAQVWRTPDGTNWTRVVENGFGNDVYNYQAPSLAVFNGNLYAGTGHGDWYDDGHPNGPLGGEVWRSGDGTTWVPVNAPGFGTQEAYRVESLLVFQNGLYAYVSHMGDSAAGADVWRCTKTVCSEQGDWTKVMDNGFGVPQIQFLTSGVVSGAYLYASAVTYNLSTGMQLWRTANGSNWEKATPYDGLGNSNNSYAYRGAMIDFNGCLTLGVTNWASGAGVWQKTLTAGFTATPTRGVPPLTVHFTNTSAGDFKTSQWDFGDGATSTEANPTHTYTVPGTYAVTLTVGDGAETSTITKPAYIMAKHFTYLPLVMKNYDPLRYDDFNDPAYDGAWNPLLWRSTGESWFHAEQHNGAMVLWNDTPATGAGARLDTRPLRSLVRSPQRSWFVEARLKMSSDRIGGHSSVQIKGHTWVNGHSWTALCSLGGDQGSSQAYYECAIIVPQGSDWVTEYHTPSLPAAYDAWQTARIEIAPGTAELRFYLNGNLIGSHISDDATALKDATDMSVTLDVWNGDTNATSTRYVDDVRITPAR